MELWHKDKNKVNLCVRDLCNLLLIVRLYCPIGSDIAPDNDGPITSPVPKADVIIATPIA